VLGHKPYRQKKKKGGKREKEKEKSQWSPHTTALCPRVLPVSSKVNNLRSCILTFFSASESCQAGGHRKKHGEG